MTDAPADSQAEDAAAPRDERREALVERLRDHIADGLVQSEVADGDIWVRVAASSWRSAAAAAKQLGLDYFCFLSGLDWKKADLGGEKLWDPEAEPSQPPDDGPGQWTVGRAGGGTRFQVICRLYDVDAKIGMTLKADIGDDNPAVDSLVPVFRGADWHEREAWEMYGIDFAGHPGLRHIYLPADFEGYPLRKDFPLLAREVKPWPGLVNVEGLPGEDASDDTAEGDSGEDAS